jgi:hypothetical protein
MVLGDDPLADAQHSDVHVAWVLREQRVLERTASLVGEHDRAVRLSPARRMVREEHVAHRRSLRRRDDPLQGNRPPGGTG